MLKTEKKYCIKKLKNGKQCGVYAMKNDEYCFVHSPKISEEERKKARSNGGKRKLFYPVQIVKNEKYIKLKNLEDLKRFYSELINGVVKGVIDLRSAGTIGYLLNGLCKVFELTDVAERMERIENYIEKINMENSNVK